MATTLPVVTVSRVEADCGFWIRCSCGHTAYRRMRIEADTLATTHRGSHATPMVEVD